MSIRAIVGATGLLVASTELPTDQTAVAWTGGTPFAEVLQKLPKTEDPVHLFNGKDLSGWDGAEGYWSVDQAGIRGANDKPLPSSTYLFTQEEYRNFRLLLEARQTVSSQHSDMHTAVAALGKRFTDTGDNAHGFRGPLLMFCHDWGIWDAYRRNRIAPMGPGPKVENVGDWNLIEILVIGNRIRLVANGTLVFDFTDEPDMLQASPIGLQLHSNDRPQQHHFRGLVLTKDPTDQLITSGGPTP
ncbi:MAG: DUF1080 domain-containing protein [Pirellulales bacterium]|nr:DUF1080 domain-containing protein [Pirellulales bacterium]